MNIRAEIRGILQEVLSEANPSEHFKDRIYDRLTSSLYTKPAFDYSSVSRYIDILRLTNFNPKHSFAISIGRFNETYISKDPVDNKYSTGNELWAVIRNNEITTIFFRNSFQRSVKVKDVDYVLNIKELVENYENKEKNPDGTVDFIFSEKQSSGSRKKVDFDLPTVELSGVTWYIDEPNEELIYSKNTKKKLSFNSLEEKYLEKVIDAVT